LHYWRYVRELRSSHLTELWELRRIAIFSESRVKAV